MASPSWQSGNLGQLIGLPQPLTAAASSISTVVTPIQNALTAISSILLIAKNFLVGTPSSSVSGIVNELLTTIQSLVNDLNQAGIYALQDYPVSTHDSHLSYYGQNLIGGLPGFVVRVGSSFLNPQDGNRPTFDTNAELTGVVAIFNTGDIGELVQALGTLGAFFGNTFKPTINPPFNVVARPVNQNFFTTYIDPITDSFIPNTLPANTASWITDTVGNQSTRIVIDKNFNILLQEPAPDSIALTWRNHPSFLPGSFVVERSQVRGGVPSLQKNSATGAAILPKTSTMMTDLSAKNGSTISTKNVMYDNTGKSVTYYADFRNPDGSPNTSLTPSPVVSFSSGLTNGVYTFIDTSTKVGIPYYYRVRSKFGSSSSAFIDITQPPWTTLNNISPALIGIINSINQYKNGESEPSIETMGYRPTTAELAAMVQVAENTIEGTRAFSTHTMSGNKWVKYALSNYNLPNIILKQITGFVNGLNQGLTSSVQDIVNFITLLQTKVDAINQIIGLIDAITSVLTAFSLPGFSFLAIPPTSGGTSAFLSAISSATSPPATSVSDYVGGVVMLAGGPGSAAIVTAFSLLTAAI